MLEMSPEMACEGHQTCLKVTERTHPVPSPFKNRLLMAASPRSAREPHIKYVSFYCQLRPSPWKGVRRTKSPWSLSCLRPGSARPCWPTPARHVLYLLTRTQIHVSWFRDLLRPSAIQFGKAEFTTRSSRAGEMAQQGRGQDLRTSTCGKRQAWACAPQQAWLWTVQQGGPLGLADPLPALAPALG